MSGAQAPGTDWARSSLRDLFGRSFGFDLRLRFDGLGRQAQRGFERAPEPAPELLRVLQHARREHDLVAFSTVAHRVEPRKALELQRRRALRFWQPNHGRKPEQAGEYVAVCFGRDAA